MNMWLIFLTGLTTGGLSCLAMQGGLLASVVTANKDKKENNQATSSAIISEDWLPLTMFLGCKLLIHTLFGFLLGALGSVIALSLEVRLAFQVFAALFMLATAGNLLNLHPIFRYVIFQPPKFLQRLVRSTSKSKNLFAPAFLGLMTVFIPCGVTQAMEVLAINSGSPVIGALTMFAFVLGTTPLFAVLGLAAAKLSDLWNKRFLKAAAWGLVVMGMWGLNGVAVVMDSPITLQKVTYPVTYFFSGDRFVSVPAVAITNGLQRIEIQAVNNGYQPRHFRVKAGQPVELKVSTQDTYSCAVAFTFKEFNIATFLQPTDSKTFTFTPTKKGSYTYACSMGMYTGTMEVI